jgi:hypothetical protein
MMTVIDASSSSDRVMEPLGYRQSPKNASGAAVERFAGVRHQVVGAPMPVRARGRADFHPEIRLGAAASGDQRDPGKPEAMRGVIATGGVPGPVAQLPRAGFRKRREDVGQRAGEGTSALPPFVE